MQALKYQATVDQDHRVVFLAPDLPDGTQLEIIALVKHQPPATRMDWSQKMGAYPRFETLEQVNTYTQTLREDRDVG